MNNNKEYKVEKKYQTKGILGKSYIRTKEVLGKAL